MVAGSTRLNCLQVNIVMSMPVHLIGIAFLSLIIRALLCPGQSSPKHLERSSRAIVPRSSAHAADDADRSRTGTRSAGYVSVVSYGGSKHNERRSWRGRGLVWLAGRLPMGRRPPRDRRRLRSVARRAYVVVNRSGTMCGRCRLSILTSDDFGRSAA